MNISNNISVKIAIKREDQIKICSQGSRRADSKLWIPRAMINPWRYCCLTSYQSFLSPTWVLSSFQEMNFCGWTLCFNTISEALDPMGLKIDPHCQFCTTTDIFQQSLPKFPISSSLELTQLCWACICLCRFMSQLIFFPKIRIINFFICFFFLPKPAEPRLWKHVALKEFLEYSNFFYFLDQFGKDHWCFQHPGVWLSSWSYWEKQSMSFVGHPNPPPSPAALKGGRHLIN